MPTIPEASLSHNPVKYQQSPEKDQHNPEKNQKNDGGKNTIINGRYNIVGTRKLSEFDENEILKDIAKRYDDGRRLIIPIGLPESGKSMFIASLIAYTSRRSRSEDNSCHFNFIGNNPEVDNILKTLDNRESLRSTTADYMTIIDIDMESNYRKEKVKVTFLDFSGEDIERIVGIRKDDNQKSAAKIKRILSACTVRRAIFAIMSPIDQKMTEIGQPSGFDKSQDDQMKSFIDNLKDTNPKLYSKTKFLFVLTKWDELPSRVSPEKYFQKHRNTLYNEYSGYSKSYGLMPYSVGEINGTTIMQISLRSPRNFWHTLYRWCTGKHVLPWWKRLFS